MKKLAVIAMSVFCAILLCGCQKEEYSKTAPALPPVESIKIDLSSFNTPTKADCRNEYFAYVVDHILNNWQNIFEQLINIPIEGFEQFVKITPVQKSNGTWLWQCEVKDGFTTYTVSLVGREKRDAVEWELSVSSEGLITVKNFVWLTGESSKDGREGEWRVVSGPTDIISPTDVAVESHWECDVNRVITKVELTYKLDHCFVCLNPFQNDSRITYMRSATSEEYDHSVQTYYNQLGLGWWSADVEWNAENGAGRVMCSSKWNDGAWHSWPGYSSENE